MADLADVEAALVDAILAILYPAGQQSPSTIGATCRVYRGWPVTSALDADRAAGVVNVTVFPLPGASRNTTRWGVVRDNLPGAARLDVAVINNTATFSGACQSGQLAGVVANNVPYVYRVKDGDVPLLVAAVLAEAIRHDQACLLSGATITVPGVGGIVARTTLSVTTRSGWTRQEQGFRVSIWSPNPMLRDAASGAIGSGLAVLAFLSLADGTGGRLRYRSTTSFDGDQSGSLYRRELIYDVEYATTSSMPADVMLFGDLGLNGTTKFS